MQGDTIIVEAHHRRAADTILPIIQPLIEAGKERYTISVAGESGSGKSETAAAIAETLADKGIASMIFQQDDYFVYPPKSNDQARRADINWVGPQEVKLDLLDDNLQAFLGGAGEIEKPLVIYQEDRVTSENMIVNNAQVAIAEGTYASLLQNVKTRIFIDRDYAATRAHREKRSRHESELDPFIDKVLDIEHRIISSHKHRANIVINTDYSVSEQA